MIREPATALSRPIYFGRLANDTKETLVMFINVKRRYWEHASCPLKTRKSTTILQCYSSRGAGNLLDGDGQVLLGQGRLV